MSREHIYRFEQLEVWLKGVRWQATGTAILKTELSQAYTEPGWIAIEQVDRLRDNGVLDYEDEDWASWYPEERLAFVNAVATKLNLQRDKLTHWFYEQD